MLPLMDAAFAAVAVAARRARNILRIKLVHVI